MAALPAEKIAEPLVLRDDGADGVTTLTLNRPGARNALSVGLMAALQTELDTIRDDNAIKVVVIAGNGPAFCAGHDLKEMRANKGREIYEALFEQCSKLMLSITHLPKPVIAKIQGIATGKQLGTVARADHFDIQRGVQLQNQIQTGAIGGQVPGLDGYLLFFAPGQSETGLKGVGVLACGR